MSLVVNKFKKINVHSLDLKETSLSNILNVKNDKPYILYTWGPNHETSVNMLTKFNQLYYRDLKEKFNLTFITLNIVTRDTPYDLVKSIKELNWNFENYIDTDGEYQMEIRDRVPDIYFIVNGKILIYKRSWREKGGGSADLSNYINEMIKSIDSKTIYFDKDFLFCTKAEAEFIRTVDKFDGLYLVKDKWISGELEMEGHYLDKYYNIESGLFTWYHKNGKISRQQYFENAQISGIETKYFESGELWVRREYRNGHLYNILELKSQKGTGLDKGDLLNGNGYYYNYDENGIKTNKIYVQNGLKNGKYFIYDEYGFIKEKHWFENGKLVR